MVGQCLDGRSRAMGWEGYGRAAPELVGWYGRGVHTPLSCLKFGSCVEIGPAVPRHPTVPDPSRGRTQRVCTVLVYLNTVPCGGGHTRFCALDPPLSVAPARGKALVFFPGCLQTGALDERCWHEATPPLEAPKWVAQVWVRQREDPLAGLEDGCAAASMAADGGMYDLPSTQ